MSESTRSSKILPTSASIPANHGRKDCSKTCCTSSCRLWQNQQTCPIWRWDCFLPIHHKGVFLKYFEDLLDPCPCLNFQNAFDLISEERLKIDGAVWNSQLFKGDPTAEPMVSRVAVHAGNYEVSTGDLCLFKQGSTWSVGECWHHFAIQDVCYTVVSSWKHIHGSMFEISQDPIVISTSCIVEALVFARKGQSALVVLPKHAMNRFN